MQTYVSSAQCWTHNVIFVQQLAVWVIRMRSYSYLLRQSGPSYQDTMLTFPACDCDPTGSSDMQCDVQTGQCNCRPNFVGKTCNKCTRNTFLEQASCKACDYCYRLVLDAVDEHESKLDKIDQLLKDVQKAPTVDNQNSKEFETKMKQILRKAGKMK